MVKNEQEVYDLIGIGFGPAGIALGVAVDDFEENRAASTHIKKLFLESAKDSTWQANMLLPATHIQHHFFRDFATPYNPRSKFTFANYLKEKGRLFRFGLLGVTPGRIEWADYISWVASQLSESVLYNKKAIAINPIVDSTGEINFVEVVTEDQNTKEKQKFIAKNLSINTGRKPFVPEMYRPFLGDRVFHSTHFIKNLKHFQSENNPNFAVIGSGQNAIEAILELSNKFPRSQIYSINRNLGFKTYDLGQFSNEVYHPEFVDYFYSLSKKERKRLFDTQMKATNYSAVGPHTSFALYWKVYEQSILGEEKIHVLRSQQVQTFGENNGKYQIFLKDIYKGKETLLDVDGVVICTGFVEETLPSPLNTIQRYLDLEDDRDINISRDYKIQTKENFNVGLYANGITERTHGISDATSFSMMALKAKNIFDTLRESIEQKEKLHV